MEEDKEIWKKDVPVLKLKVLDMVPVSQANVWKKLGIDYRDGSDLINMMIKEGLVVKTKKDKTYSIAITKNGRIYRIILACLMTFFDGRGYGCKIKK